MTSHSTRPERHSIARQQVSAALAECLAELEKRSGPPAPGRRRQG